MLNFDELKLTRILIIVDVVILLTFTDDALSIDLGFGFDANGVNSTGAKLSPFVAKENKNYHFLTELHGDIEEENIGGELTKEETVLNDTVKDFPGNEMKKRKLPSIKHKFKRNNPTSSDSKNLLRQSSLTSERPLFLTVELDSRREKRLINRKNVKIKRDLEITLPLNNNENDTSITNQSFDKSLHNISLAQNFSSENITIEYIPAGNNSLNVSFVFSDLFNSTLIEAKNKTSTPKNNNKSNYTLYELQMIKVGVLCGVLTLLLLSTCSMLLKVLARHVDRDKTYMY